MILPLDVQNTREGTDFIMYMFWYIMFMSSLFYVTVVLPFGLFFSETDEEKEFVSVIAIILIFTFFLEMAHLPSFQKRGHSTVRFSSRDLPFVFIYELLILPNYGENLLYDFRKSSFCGC